ncbi:hypothetical protein [Microbacterium sp. C7(2022)]|uniref:hypothetical protein n=1 Tax=Microbacterium sp. C7(2022) TaxID=2992759 RepID=UPI00237B0620|nr:hypothetical protein [Microbacterium sp. C7(2022)]MDE0546890.1 hypothetical protein [Microbacterium sp. C7(2022)]
MRFEHDTLGPERHGLTDHLALHPIFFFGTDEVERSKILPEDQAGGPLRDAWERKSMLGSLDRTVMGALAIGIGMPLRAAVLRVRSRTSTQGHYSWGETESDITVTPAPAQEPLIRERPRARMAVRA